MVDARHRGAEGAVVGGVPTFRTVGGALAAAPYDGARPWVVFIRDGRYREKLTVDKPNVTFLGESRDGTVLTFDAASSTPRPDGTPHGTKGSYTLRIAAPDFRAERLTIANGFDFDANARKAADDPTRLQNTQAVALLTDVGSDRAVFRDVRLDGYHDTLYANAGRAYFHRCLVLGHVDFIFGAGRAVFEDCDIVSRELASRHPGDPAGGNGWVAAPSTPIAQPYGFLFVRSRLKRESPAVAPGSVGLGRPWHPGGDPLAIGSAVFVDCWMDDHVGARGWDRMSSVDRESGVRFWFEPMNARFYEFGSTGPGAVTSPTRRVLAEGEVRAYTVARVLDGWEPPR
ncbi:MAG: pectinesterase family protein [Gemmatimonadota bacterium]